MSKSAPTRREIIAADPDAALEEQRAWEQWEKDLKTDQAYYGLCWPYHCRNCGGRGYHAWREPHGEMLSEPCIACLCGGDADGHPICPLCAARLSLDMSWAPDVVGAPPCENCRWDMTDGGFPTW